MLSIDVGHFKCKLIMKIGTGVCVCKPREPIVLPSMIQCAGSIMHPNPYPIILQSETDIHIHPLTRELNWHARKMMCYVRQS